MQQLTTKEPENPYAGSNPLTVIITSGGTKIKIDDVRHIGNFSSGTTGAHIAEEFLQRNTRVCYLHARDAKRPFHHQLSLDPTKPRSAELARINTVANELEHHKVNLHEESFETFDEYAAKLEHLVKNTNARVIILAAAVSDYHCQPKKGKMKSDPDTVQLELTKTPKLISQIKLWNPTIFQVGFKLLSDVSPSELIDIAYQHGIKSHSNLTVANAVHGADFKNRLTFLITPEKGITPVTLASLPATLAQVVSHRVSQKVYKHNITISTHYHSAFAAELEQFKKAVRLLYQHNLFEPYYHGAHAHFGFVALRVKQGGFLITSKASNKQEMSINDMVYVSHVDFENRVLHVESDGTKPTLNANVAAALFAARPEITMIVHAHISLGTTNKTSTDFAPGTQEDVDEVMRYMGGSEKIIEQLNHGIIVVGSSASQIINIIGEQHAYATYPHYYDAIYGRFQKSTDFTDLVEKEVSKDHTILDLAAGTGDVSNQLSQRGFKNLTLTDKNAGMLAVAQEKIGRSVAAVVASFDTLKNDLGNSQMSIVTNNQNNTPNNLQKNTQKNHQKPYLTVSSQTPTLFDAIIIRQAINYSMNLQNLLHTMRQIKQCLRGDGKLIFNAPNFTGQSSYPPTTSIYHWFDYHVTVREQNFVEGNILTHSQHSTLLRHDGLEIKTIYDLNRFALFTKEEFEIALREAGFNSIHFHGDALQEYYSDSRTLYCVAQ